MPKQETPSQQQLLPAEARVLSLLSPAQDQGKRGTCTAFAITALHESRRATDTGTTVKLSEEVLYWGAKQADKNCTSGTSFRSAHLALGTWGQPQADLWPYDPSRTEGTDYIPPPEAIDPKNCYFGRLEWITLDVVAVKIHLAAGRTVAASVEVSLGFFTTPNGAIPLPKPSELLAENHAILLTGYSDGSNTFQFRNSWGTDWGASGYGKLPYDYFLKHGKSACVLSPKT